MTREEILNTPMQWFSANDKWPAFPRGHCFGLSKGIDHWPKSTSLGFVCISPLGHIRRDDGTCVFCLHKEGVVG